MPYTKTMVTLGAEELLTEKISEMAEVDLERAYASGYLAGLERTGGR